MKTTHKTKDRRTRTPQNTRVFYGSVSSSCSPCSTRHATLLCKSTDKSKMREERDCHNRQVVVHTLVVPVVFPVVHSLL